MKFPYTSLAVLGAFILVGGVYAAVVLTLPNGTLEERASNGYATPQTTSKEITLADGSCRKITSTTNTQYFIPTSSMGQSDAFIAHLPVVVSVGSCITYSWVQGGFSACSLSCGGGTQTQVVQCRDSVGTVVADANCTAAKPATSQSCNMQVCPINIQDSVGRHCDIGGGWGWRDARTNVNYGVPYLFGRPGYNGGYKQEYGPFCSTPEVGIMADCWVNVDDPTTNYDGPLCKNGKSPIQGGDAGISCPVGSTPYGGGCYFPNTSPNKPSSCNGSNPSDECCFFICK